MPRSTLSSHTFLVYSRIRSISAGYNLRILYIEQDGRIIILLAVGTHGDVY